MGLSGLPQTLSEMAARIEASELRPTATSEDIQRLVERAVRLNLRAVCINPCRVREAAACNPSADLLVVSVVGFPLGTSTTSTKLREAEGALDDGADELDMVVNLGWFLGGNRDRCFRELAEMVRISQPRTVKAIIEAGYLSDSAIYELCRLVVDAGVGAVKTSTGFGPPGATVEKVRLIRSAVGPKLPIKAAGGIRSWTNAISLLEAGATLIGTSTPEAVLSVGPSD